MNARHFIRSAIRMTVFASPGFRRFALAISVPTLALSGCYIIPVNSDGKPYYAMGILAAPPVPNGASNYSSGALAASAPNVVPGDAPTAFVRYAAPAGAPPPIALNVRLYPANEIGTQSGVLTGTVTNLMRGKGRFQFNYKGELLAGEATRVSGEERRGVASAYGPNGTYASCDYQMESPLQGAGTCDFSDGAKYQVHIGG